MTDQCMFSGQGNIPKNIRMQNRTDIFGNGNEPTRIDIDSKQFKLEIQKLIKEH